MSTNDPTRLPVPPDAQAVIDFWFGPRDEARADWFRADAAFDAQIRQRFATLIDAAVADGLRDWDRSPDGALARVLLLDQFTRNVFRHTPRAFSGDALALAAATSLVTKGNDRSLPPLRRWFVYLPFEHAESRAVQAESMRLFTALAHEHPAMADALEWARRHQVVVERFGRFPHRNAVLGRISTPEEEAFLREPGSRF